MKYTAKQFQRGENEGKWAVFTGKKYFTGTLTEDKREAEYSALVYTGHWHRDQVDKVHDQLVKGGWVDEDDRDARGWLA